MGLCRVEFSHRHFPLDTKIDALYTRDGLEYCLQRLNGLGVEFYDGNNGGLCLHVDSL